MATTVLGLKTFAASDPVDYNEINDNYNKIDNGVKTALQGRAAHNLLDNSDFRNPVNQRGVTQTSQDSVYLVDRWLSNSVSSANIIRVDNDGITLVPDSNVDCGIFQRLEHYTEMKGKVYTVAICVNNSWECKTFIMGNLPEGHRFNNGLLFFSVDSLHILFRAYSSYVSSITIQSVALYEGSYTADTLPAYVPKGYSAELAECQRYFQATDNPFFVGYASTGVNYHGVSFFTPMRIVPTITVSSQNGFGVVVVSGTRNGFIARNDNSNTAQIIWNASADL